MSPSPIPRHSYTQLRLVLILGNHIVESNLGELYQDVDTILDEYNVRRPDILFFSTARLDLVGEKAMEGPPDLAIEILSPSSVDVDREVKFEQYRKAGIAHYWIVDPQGETIEAFRLVRGQYVGGAAGGGSDEVRLEPFPDLAIPLQQLWRRPGAATG